jgi:adenylosuccinate lyase
VLEAEEPFKKGQKGSSAMPHKRNPIICERICGLARVIRANTLVAMENMTLWHERDISHSSAERVILPDSTILLDYILNKFVEVILGLVVYPERMKENLEKTGGLIFSQRVLLKLIEKGMQREKAYQLVQKNAMKTWEAYAKGKTTRDHFKKLLLQDKEITAVLPFQEIEGLFEAKYFLRHLKTIFKRLERKA